MSFKIRNRESGIALILILLVLMILSAITATLVTMTGTETTVNANYRSEEVALFAARAGLYEVTDRMMQLNAASIATSIPTVVPSATNSGILYLINQTSATGTVAPWSITNKYADNELCHEGYTIAGMTNATPDVPCTTLPSGSAWYSTVSSNAPWSGTTAAMPYVWVRLSWKLNNSISYLTTTTTGGVTTAATANYSVNGTGTAATPVCWNGASEVLLTPSTNTLCEQMIIPSGATAGTADTPVYLVTALAVTSTGARQVVQTEVALPPPAAIATPAGFSAPDGFFAVSTTCSSTAPPNEGTAPNTAPFYMPGGSSTDGYSSANGGTYAGTKSAALGNVGSNGSVLIIGGSTVGGYVHIPTAYSAVNGNCTTNPSDLYTAGGSKYGPTNTSPSCQNAACGVQGIGSYNPPVPVIPAPGTAEVTQGSGTRTITGGSYDNVNLSGGGTLTLTAPGIYNINCLSVAGGSTLAISPATAQVVINVTGNMSATGSTCSSNPQDSNHVVAPINLSGGSVSNTSGIAANLIINYAGTSDVDVEGGSGAYLVVNAPKAAILAVGGSDLYGALIGNTLNDSGGSKLHFDSSLTTAPSVTWSVSTAASTSNYQTIGFRTLPY
jgi:hypothetical protein